MSCPDDKVCENCPCSHEDDVCFPQEREIRLRTEDGKPVVCCEICGSTDLDFDGWDIDKCRACGHWRYR